MAVLKTICILFILITEVYLHANEFEDAFSTAIPGGFAFDKAKMSDLVKKFMEHFKNPDSMNMPLPVPDPLPMPDREYPLLAKVYTSNVSAFGVSHLKIENLTSDFVEMKVHFGLRMPKLEITGDYFYKWLFQNYSGDFNVTIINALSDCNAQLEVTRFGELEVADIKMELSTRDKIHFNVQNAGMIGFVLNSLGEVIFDGIKPYIFKIINGNIRGNINEHLKKLKVMFPNSIPPIDLAIAEARKFVRNNEWDPYFAPDYQYATSIYSIDITHNVVMGLSSFYRVGNVKVLMDNLTLFIEANIATETLEGMCNWEAGIAGILTKSGMMSFTVEYIKVMILIGQPLDIRKKPKVTDINIKVGNVQLRMDGSGLPDYIAEFAVNVVPNILRYQIVQAAEMPIKRKIQEVLDNTDIEQAILEKLPIIDRQLYKTDVSVIEDSFVEEGLVLKGKELDQELIL